MRTSIRLFGFREGIKCWFRLKFMPIQSWWWNLIGKTWCDGYGYHHIWGVKEEDCTRKHYKGHKAGLKARHIAASRIPSTTPDGKCIYCGEFM